MRHRLGVICAVCRRYYRTTESRTCPTCGDSARVHIRPFEPYFDTALGTWITGPREKSRILKERGLIEVGGEYEKHIRGADLPIPPVDFGITVDDVGMKLKEIREKMHDPDYRRKYGA